MSVRVLVALIGVLGVTAVARAAESDWQDIAPGARARLISSDVRDANGQTWVGLEVDLAPGLKTYWRIPGEAGIPTQIDWKGSQGVAGLEPSWPIPLREVDAGLVEYVYRDTFTLPIALTVSGDSALLATDIVMGVCSDICVPVKAHFDLPLGFEKPVRADGLRVRQALAAVPRSWADKAAPVDAVRFDAARAVLAFSVDEGALDPSSLIVDAGDAGPYFGLPKKSPETGLYEAMLLTGLGSGAVQPQEVRFTFMTRNGPFELLREVSAGPGT